MRIFCTLFAIALFAGTFQPLVADTLEDSFAYISPRPWTTLVPKESVLIFRPHHQMTSPGEDRLPSITLTGSASGTHSGEWVVADDARTLIFKPSKQFEPGEVVSVALSASPDIWIAEYRFTVSPKRGPLLELATLDDPCLDAPASESEEIEAHMAMMQMENGFPYPPDFPDFDILTNNDPTPGMVFLTPANYLTIMNHDGTPVFFMDYGKKITNFQPQANGTLTFFERGGRGAVPPHRLFVMDNTYTIVDEYTAANGYRMDFHEFLLLENGHALLLIYDRQLVDMSQIVPGGRPSATVQGLVIQELDASKNLIFQWRSWDHIPITDAADGIDLTRGFIDYVHGNAIEVDWDGNLLLSNRNLDEITKIDRNTGDVIWRFGGKGNQFQMDTGGQFFTRQHDVRRLPNGHISIFDNGNASSPQESRAVEFRLDVGSTKVATQVWEYRHPMTLFGPFVGSHRTLPTGNRMVSWGNTRRISEVRPDGFVEWELRMFDDITYRAYPDETWNAVAAVPTLWADVDDAAESATLHFIRFGDESVAWFDIYRGTAPEPTELVASTAQHSLDIHNFAAGTELHFRVVARDEQGNETGYSNEISLTPSFSEDTPPYTASVRLRPRTLNLTSLGRWVQARVTLPEGCACAMSDIEHNPILLNGTVSGEIIELDETVAASTFGSAGLGFDVRFPREAVIDVLNEGDSVEVIIGGRVGDIPFEGGDFIRVIGNGSESRPVPRR
jgi:hypothetical protein